MPSSLVSGEPRTIASATADLRSGAVTATQLLEEATRVADHLDGPLGVYLHRTQETARVAAARVDERLQAGRPVGRLDE